MKILLIAPSIYMSERFADMIYAPKDLAVDLADGLVSAGHAVTFAAAPDIKTKATLLAGEQSYIDAYVEQRSDTERLLIKRTYELDLLSRAFAAAQPEAFDIVHVFAITAAHYLERFTRVPVVYTIHDPLPAKGTLSRIIFEQFAGHRFISISNSQRRGELSLRFEATVYHAVDVQRYPFVEAPAARWVFMGRMVPEKGLDDALKAAVVMHAPLVAASDWETADAQNPFIQSLTPLLDNPMIKKVGVVDRDKRAALLGSARGLLFPIKWEEPFGMVMIEAMACGTPVVAYDHGSVSEVVKDGVTGYIVRPQDGVAGLVAAMRAIDRIDRRACRARVEKLFSVSTMVRGHESVYKKILSAS